MRVISLYQPWAQLVVDGFKRYETRRWATAYRGPLAIHSTKRMPPVAMQFAQTNAACQEALSHLHGPAWWADPMKRLPQGMILSVVWLGDCEPTEVVRERLEGLEDFAELEFGGYDDGRHAWCLRDPIGLPYPIPARGYQGFWKIDDSLLPDNIVAASRHPA